MSSKHRTIENLQRLINHPATPEHEREAAKLALDRILGPKQKEGRQRPSVAQIFRKSMRNVNS